MHSGSRPHQLVQLNHPARLALRSTDDELSRVNTSGTFALVFRDGDYSEYEFCVDNSAASIPVFGRLDAGAVLDAYNGLRQNQCRERRLDDLTKHRIKFTISAPAGGSPNEGSSEFERLASLFDNIQGSFMGSASATMSQTSHYPSNVRPFASFTRSTGWQLHCSGDIFYVLPREYNARDLPANSRTLNDVPYLDRNNWFTNLSTQDASRLLVVGDSISFFDTYQQLTPIEYAHNRIHSQDFITARVVPKLYRLRGVDHFQLNLVSLATYGPATSFNRPRRPLRLPLQSVPVSAPRFNAASTIMPPEDSEAENAEGYESADDRFESFASVRDSASPSPALSSDGG